MSFVVQMPALGESVTEGTVTRWLKSEGDSVDIDEPLLEVSTDKVDTEVPSPKAGVLSKILAPEDTTVLIGGDLAEIAEPGTAPNTNTVPPETAREKAETELTLQPKITAEVEAQNTSGTPVKMPALGESVTEGTITRWLKNVGDSVAVDEALVEVSTDKVDTEIPSPVAGVLLSINADADDTVQVGEIIATIGDRAATPPTDKPKPAPVAQKTEPSLATSAPAKPAAQSSQVATPAPKPQSTFTDTDTPNYASSNGTPYVTPLVRKLAQEHKIDLRTIQGTGVGGRIRKQDVLAAANLETEPSSLATIPAVTPAQVNGSAASVSTKKTGSATIPGVRPDLAQLRGTTQKINRIRQITAKTTRESLAHSAQLTQVHEINFTKLVVLRARSKAAFEQKYNTKLTFLPFIAKATIEALILHPNINASIDEDKKEITYYDKVNLGIAVDTEQGLLSPVIHNASALSLPDLAKAIVDIAGRARNGGLKPDEVFGGTFTITNIGSNGAITDTPILVPPQAAMLGTGAIVKRASVVPDEDGGDSIAIHSVALFPLTYDHRLIDGADAGRFLTTIKARIEEADFTTDLGL